MNAQEEARRKAEIMLAFAEGKGVEYRLIVASDEWWKETESPSWFWNYCEYRIAPPKKRKVEKWQWVIEYHDNNRKCQWLTARFYADQSEVEADSPRCTVIKRADWTRIEVEE